MDTFDDTVHPFVLPVTYVKGNDNAAIALFRSTGSEGNTDARLGLSPTGSLNVDQIFSIFHGTRENVEYFVGLWNAMRNVEGNDGFRNSACDPRDERKRHRIENWTPVARKCPLDVGCSGAGHGSETSKREGSFAVKQTVLDAGDQHQIKDVTEELSGGGDKKKFHCGVHGCGEVLSSLASYEAHYHHRHSYVCDTCRRAFVSDFLLDIHLQENHDSYFAVLSPRMDMYRCLVESCTEKFRTPQLRKDHLVSVHKFPTSFSFHQPIKESRSKFRGQSSPQPVRADIPLAMESSCLPSVDSDITAMDTEGPPPVIPTTKTRKKKKSPQLNEKSEQGKRVPASICFGRGSQRAFQQPRGRGRGGRGRNWYQTESAMETNTSVDITTVDMNDLSKALS